MSWRPDRAAALALLHEYTKGESLRRHAYAALVRPSKSVMDLEAGSVKKRMKDKAFAKAVSREDLLRGADELGLPLETHIANVIGSLRERADDLGLRGTPSDL